MARLKLRTDLWNRRRPASPCARNRARSFKPNKQSVGPEPCELCALWPFRPFLQSTRLCRVQPLTPQSKQPSLRSAPTPATPHAPNAMPARPGSYAATPHATDSSIANEKTILGDFNPQNAVLRTGNPNLAFVMLSTPDGFYQTAVNLSDPQHLNQTMKRFDIVIGSGRHGQTYLYWDEDQLYELPVSWWSYAHRWVDSPGYPDGVLHWDRPARPRCLECHANYFPTIAMPSHYAKDSLVLGIGCERCHGPGALHVSRERSATPPAAGSPQLAIVNPAHLTRDQQIGLTARFVTPASPRQSSPRSLISWATISRTTSRSARPLPINLSCRQSTAARSALIHEPVLYLRPAHLFHLSQRA